MFDQTLNLVAEAGRDQWTHPAGADAEPVPDLVFDQNSGLEFFAAQMAHAAKRGWVWCRRWQSAVGVVDCQCRRIEVVQFLHVRLVKLFLN